MEMMGVFSGILLSGIFSLHFCYMLLQRHTAVCGIESVPRTKRICNVDYAQFVIGGFRYIGKWKSKLMNK